MIETTHTINICHHNEYINNAYLYTLDAYKRAFTAILSKTALSYGIDPSSIIMEDASAGNYLIEDANLLTNQLDPIEVYLKNYVLNKTFLDTKCQMTLGNFITTEETFKYDILLQISSIIDNVVTRGMKPSMYNIISFTITGDLRFKIGVKLLKANV